ncbi:F-box protein At2g26850-like isoform X1 [Lathyrus oleraceus]|nr:F-box protein At2g26850-like isoform X1 [Pisum sativum]
MVAHVCTHLRNNSRSDYLWNQHVEHKWSKLVGEDFHNEWNYHIGKIRNEESLVLHHNQSKSYGNISGDHPYQRLHSYLKSNRALDDLIKNHSQMALYICLETGRFWFPIQIYKATKKTLYCYDALVSYDSRTNTFRARSTNAGKRLVERDIDWERLRKPPPKTFLVDYYEYNNLNDLKPGDRVEIQKRRRRAFPYHDWVYASICHFQSCDQDINHCSCQDNDLLNMMIYKRSSIHKYSMSKRMRHIIRYEEFNFLNGIRKLTDEEIGKWRNLDSTL